MENQTSFLESLANMLPADRKAEFLEKLALLTPEERVEQEAAAQAYYLSLRENRNQKHYREAVRMAQQQVRAGYADRRPEGAAATRRRNQALRLKSYPRGAWDGEQPHG